MLRDNLGRRIYVFRPGRWDPDKVSEIIIEDLSRKIIFN